MIAWLGLVLAAPPGVPLVELPELATPELLDDDTRWIEQDAPRVAVVARWALPDEALELRLALQLVEASLLAEDDRARALDLLGASWSVRGGASGLTLRLEAPAATVEEALALIVSGLERPRGGRAIRRAASSWGRWRGELELSLERLHARAVNHAWYPAGHPSRHQASEEELSGLGLGHVRRATERVLAEGARRVAVVGPVDEALVAGLAALLPPGGTSELPREAPAPAVGVTVVDRPGFDSALLTVCVQAMVPSEREALELLLGALVGDFSSRAVQDLREERGWIYTTWLEVVRERACVQTEARTAQAVPVLLALDEHLDASLLDPLELQRARARHAVELASDAGSAGRVAEALVAAEGHEAEGRRHAAGLEAAGLDELGQRTLARDRRVWVLTGDADVLWPAVEASGRAARLVRGDELATAR